MLRKSSTSAPCALKDAGCEFSPKLLIAKVFSLHFFATAIGDGTTDYHMLCGDIIYENHCFGMTDPIKPQ